MISQNQPLLHPGFGAAGWLARAQDETGFARPAFRDRDQSMMAEAILAAMAGGHRATPNPTVGCVIASGDEIIARGVTETFGGRHAEVMALEAAGDRARAATAYVTLEPCGHQGKQGPCSAQLIAAGIRRCVVGAADPHPLVAGGGLDQLRSAGIEVVTDVLAAECEALHAPFLQTLASDTIYLALKWAQTIDGQLAADDGESQWITGPAARALTHWYRQTYDLIVVGAGTALADQPSLTVRDCAPPRDRSPVKLIWDPAGLLADPEPAVRATLLHKTLAGPVVYAGPEERPDWLAKHGDVHVVDDALVEPSMTSLRTTLHSRAVKAALGRPAQSAMIEGGGQLLRAVLDDQGFHRAHVFIAPAFLGQGQHNISPTARSMAKIQRWPVLSTAALGQDVLLEFQGPAAIRV